MYLAHNYIQALLIPALPAFAVVAAAAMHLVTDSLNSCPLHCNSIPVPPTNA